jgi:hypothetical protein
MCITLIEYIDKIVLRYYYVLYDKKKNKIYTFSIIFFLTLQYCVTHTAFYNYFSKKMLDVKIVNS